MWFYIFCLVGVTVVALAGSLVLRPLGAPDAVPLAVLVVLGVLGSSLQEPDAGPAVGLSVTSIILVAALGLTGPFGAAVVGAVSYLVELRRQRLEARVFNAASTALISAVAGLAYLAMRGVVDPAQAEPAFLLLRVGVPLLIANGVLLVVNAATLAGIVRITQGTPVWSVISRMLSTSGLSYLGYGVIGFLFVVLWGPGQVGVVSAVLILAPLFVARWVYQQYGDERRAHKRTIGSMITAAELNDVYTRGHGQRVAALCELMARELGMGHHRLDALRSAALLHDVGMIGVRGAVLRQSAALDLDDLAQIQRHPELGVEMVQEIDFLHESVDGIRHHHERFDGRGYPDGLAADQIPEFARMIAVADAFDSMTTTRSYRPALSVAEALRTLRERAGSHLDPVCVEALEQGLEGQPWEPNRIDGATMARAGGAHDHDDPAVSDLMADRSEELRARGAALARRAREQPTEPEPSDDLPVQPSAPRAAHPPAGSNRTGPTCYMGPR